MSRFTHIDSPTALPGVCTMCGRPTDPNGFVDTSLQIDFHGAIQVCYGCVKAMYDVFGFDATARSIIDEQNVANVHQLVETVKAFQEQVDDAFKAINTHVAGLDRSFVQSFDVLVRAAAARERIIEASNDRAAESLGFDELGIDSDELGARS